MPINKICQICGINYKVRSSRKNSIVCSISCRQKWFKDNWIKDNIGPNLNRKFPEKWKRNISKGIKGKNLNDKNGFWKGKEVGLYGLHAWVRRHKPKSMFCEKCKIRKPQDLANISENYKRDVNDFEWLCRSCHMKKHAELKRMEVKRNGN